MKWFHKIIKDRNKRFYLFTLSFLLVALFRSPLSWCIALLIWFLYLLLSFRDSSHRSMRLFYTVMMLLIGGLFLVNLALKLQTLFL